MLSPAQALKHMAEQHQHKNTMGMPFVRSPMSQNTAPQQVNPNRNIVNSSPFGNDFGQFNNSDFMNKNLTPAGGNSQFEIASKQEMMFSQQQSHHMPQMQTKMNPNAFNKQQFQLVRFH